MAIVGPIIRRELEPILANVVEAAPFVFTAGAIPTICRSMSRGRRARRWATSTSTSPCAARTSRGFCRP